MVLKINVINWKIFVDGHISLGNFTPITLAGNEPGGVDKYLHKFPTPIGARFFMPFQAVHQLFFCFFTLYTN
jgi:hypothetical protein